METLSSALLICLTARLALPTAFAASLLSTELHSCSLSVGDNVRTAALLSRRRRESTSNSPTLWPNCAVPYELDTNLERGGRHLRHQLLRAMMLWSKESEVLFVPRTEQRHYVRIAWGDRCCSDVGRQGGEHLIVLSTACANARSLLHHLGHVIGLPHSDIKHTAKQQRNNLLPSDNNQQRQLELSKQYLGVNIDLTAILSNSDRQQESIMADQYHAVTGKEQLAGNAYRQKIGNKDVLQARLLYASQKCCGGFYRARPVKRMAYDPLQVIHNSESPANYSSESDCYWYIQARNGHRVVLDRASIFNLEHDADCRYDYLEVIDIATGNASRFCGNHINLPIMSTSRFGFAVRFHSDSRIQGQGFHVYYRSVADKCFISNGGCQHTCHSTIGGRWCSCQRGYRLTDDGRSCVAECQHLLTNSSGTVMSPGYPDNYPPNLNCLWIIKAPANYRIVLNIHDFHIENTKNCARDYVDVRFGQYSDSLFFGRMCGELVNPPVEIPTDKNNLRLHFQTDSAKQFKGFNATYHFERVVLLRE